MPAALVAIPLVGSFAAGLFRPNQARRWALATLIAEVLLLLAAVSGGLAQLSVLTFDTLGLSLALRPTGVFAMAIALLVVLLAIAAAREESAVAVIPSALIGLSGAVLVAATSASVVTSVLALSIVVAALTVALVSDRATRVTGRVIQRFLTWLALAVSAVLVSGILDRFYARQPGPGILGPVAALFVVGVGVAVAAFPWAFWLPSLCAESPIGAGLAVGLLGSATLTIVAGDIGSNPWLLNEASGRTALVVAGGVAGVVSALLARGEKDSRRSFAFLISANADFALVGLATAVPIDPTGVVWALGAQSLAAALGLTCLGSAEGELTGLFHRRPLLAIGLIVAALSVIGMPLTAGYIGRWLLASTVAGQYVLLLGAAAVASAIGGLAAWQSLEKLFDRADAPTEPWRPIDVVALAIALLLVIGGFDPMPLLSLLQP